MLVFINKVITWKLLQHSKTTKIKENNRFFDDLPLRLIICNVGTASYKLADLFERLRSH